MSYSGPKKVNILCHQIPIKVKKIPASKYATFETRKYEIEVSTAPMGDTVERQSVLHELIHAIEFSNTGNKNFTESQVETLANGIYSLIRDNKEFIKWVQKK